MAAQGFLPNYTSAVAVTPSDGTSQHYMAFLVTVGGTITIRPASNAADVQLTVAASVVYPIEVTAIRSTGTAATGIVGLS